MYLLNLKLLAPTILPPMPGLPSCWIWCHSVTCACSSHVTYWPLQRRARWSPSCDNWTTCTCPESIGSACSSAWTMRVHYSSCNQCITYNLCMLMYAAHSENSPAYILDIVQSQRSASHRPGLRSADSNDYVKPQLNTKLGEWSFLYTGPPAWNQLPSSIRCVHYEQF